MATELKPMRLTLQEALEDETTGKGSNSRLILLMATLVFVVSLVLCLAVHCFMGKNMESLINSFVLALSGTVIPYATNLVVKAVVAKTTTPGQS